MAKNGDLREIIRRTQKRTGGYQTTLKFVPKGIIIKQVNR